MTTREAYELLGLKPPIGAEEVRSAYRRKALETHPDRFAEPKRPIQERRFMEIREAYARLRADGFPELESEVPAVDFPARPVGRNFAPKNPEPSSMSERLGFSWRAKPGPWLFWGAAIPAAAALLAYLVRRWVDVLRYSP